jgi:hypothetical protein
MSCCSAVVHQLPECFHISLLGLEFSMASCTPMFPYVCGPNLNRERMCVGVWYVHQTHVTKLLHVGHRA